MSKAIAEIAIGASLIALDILAPEIGIPLTATWASALAGVGASLVIGGVGTLLTKQQQGLAGNVLNPIQPWNVIYGEAKIGGTVVYMEETGESDKYLHLIYVLACHPCEAVGSILFDSKRVCLDSTGNSLSFGGSTSVVASQQTVNISSITRTNNVVTVVMTGAMPLPASTAAGPALQTGDTVQIQNVTADTTLNGLYVIQMVNSTTFTYICGGNPVSITSQGQVKTQWPDYGDTIHAEIALGDQTSNPFPGLTASGDAGSNGLWTSAHALRGRTAVYLRLKYGGNTYASGMPSIAFLVSGKNDIYDPRGGAGSFTLPAPGVTTWEMISGVATEQPTGSSSYSYIVVAKDFSGNILSVSAAGSTSTAAASLSGTNYNAITWADVPGTATYQLYRTVGGATQGIITATALTWFNDTGQTGDGSSAPAASSGYNGYTANAALCIADFLTQQTWGFKCNYGSDVPTANLIAAANICDESVSLANGGTESRYSCNGAFQLSAKRGEILQNLLTSCAGRITYAGGQYVIWPAAWPGVSASFGSKPIASAILSVTSAHAVAGVVANSDGVTPEPPVAEIDLWDVRNFGSHISATYLGFGRGAALDSSAAWSSRTDTWQLLPNPSWPSWGWDGGSGYAYSISSGALLASSLVVTLFNWNSLPSSGGPSTFDIYDCTLTITYDDGSTQTLRPTTTNVIAAGGSSDATITDPGNAIDSDPATYARISATQFGSFSPGILQLYSFAVVSSTPPTGGGSIAETSPVSNLPLAGPFQWKPKLGVRDLYNGVKATYVCPANNWQPSDMPPYAQDVDHGYSSDANLTADGGDRRWLDLQFPFTISTAAAQRLAKIELLRRRQQGSGTFVCNLAMYQLTALDVIAFTLPVLSWSDKLLEVSSHRFTVQKDDNAMTLGTEIDVQETDPSVYTWSTTEELSAEGYSQSSVVGTQSTPTAPSGVTASNSTVAGTGVATGQVQVSWTAPADGWVTNGGQTIVQYSLDNVNWIALGTFDSSVTTTYVPNVAAGQTYWVRVAFVNTVGVQSAWTVYGPLTATGSSLTITRTGVLGIVIDGGGSAPATGSKGYLECPYAGTITGWTLLADASGSAQITVKKSTYSGFPTTSSIVASAPPNLSSAQKGTSSTLTGWTTAVSAGDVLEFNLDSVATCTRLILELQITKA